MTSYRDQVVIVTGAASGIGLALARQLGEAGAVVTLADVSENAVKEAAAALSGAGHRATGIALDVTDREAVQALVDATVAESGRLDYMFNNAGVGIGGEARDFSIDDWRKVIDVNLYGVINGILAAYPVMIRQGHGHIANTSSLAGLIPFAGEIPYVASKYAVVGISHTLRVEGADLGVRVTCVCPGKIETPIYDSSEIVGFDRDRVLAEWPEGITAEQCAAIILRGVARNKATIVITRFAKVLSWLHRLSPNLVIWATRRYLRKMRAYRTDT